MKLSHRDRDMSRHVPREASSLLKIPAPPNHNISEEFLHAEFTSALNLLKPGKAPGINRICPEFILHGTLKSWLRKFPSSYLHHFKILTPRIWRRADVVAITKPNEPLDDRKKELTTLPKKGVTQDSVLDPLVSISTSMIFLLPITSRIYADADDLAKVHQAVEWTSLERTLNQVMLTPSLCLQKW